ncbi:hypothetical protein [Burkholderia mallei]|uniref:hypothetical protein n=1 Tax=Burkholderia mallei TaxID=13373 RepID=UPI0015C4FAB8|nr:hypothetical protein [Burkholderia mallei]
MMSEGGRDLPPTNRASRSLVKFVFGEEDEHEEALYGTANHRVSEGSRIITDTHVTPASVHDSQPYLDRLDRQRERFEFKVEAVGLDA